MFIRSSKVVIVDIKAEDARNEGKERGGMTRGKRRKRKEVKGGNKSDPVPATCDRYVTKHEVWPGCECGPRSRRNGLTVKLFYLF